MSSLTPIRLSYWKDQLSVRSLFSTSFHHIFSPHNIDSICQQLSNRFKRCFWSPAFTTLAFLLQILDSAATLRDAVSNFLIQLKAQGIDDLPSADPSAFCQARKRLPIELLYILLHQLRQRFSLMSHIHKDGRWRGRRLWIYDGTTVSMPDTPDLQAVFPQPPGQKKGCGFPMPQIGVLFCWASGAVESLVIDNRLPHDSVLFQRLIEQIGPGDVVLADRAMSSFLILARLRSKGIHAIFRLHHRRKADFRKGKRLGPRERIQCLKKPRYRSEMPVSEEFYQSLPSELQVRLIKVKKTRKGFRSKEMILMTTLLSAEVAPAEEIQALYGDRWFAELNFRSLKTHMKMEVLRGKSEEVVTKEILMYMLAYNLIRMLMWESVIEYGGKVSRLSLKGALKRVTKYLERLFNGRGEGLLELISDQIRRDLVPKREGRYEPRRRKRRSKEYSLLTKPRSHYHKHGDDMAR